MTNVQGQYIFDFSESDLRFGLLNKTELRLSTPDSFHSLSTETASISGLCDIAIGVKQQVGPTGSNFHLAVILLQTEDTQLSRPMP